MLIILLFLITVFLMPIRIIKVGNKCVISLQQEKHPHMSKKTDRPLTQFLLQNSLYATSFTQNVKNHFDCIVDNNYSAYCLCSGYPIWPIFQTCSRQPDSSLVPESIRQCQKFNVNLRKCRWDSSSNNLVVSI